MALSMPIKNTFPPSYITSSMNGSVPDELLSTVEPDKTSRIFLLVTIVARAMRALHAAALQNGIVLTTTGRGRTFQQQYDLFLQRHTPVSKAVYDATASNGNGNKRLWPEAVSKYGQPSIYWLLKAGYAAAAVPGTSPHGLWVADDLAEIVNGASVALRATTIQWLYANAPKYGFGWSIPSETWHVQWAVGDAIPQAILDYEKSTNTTPPTTPPSTPPTTPPSSGDTFMLGLIQLVDADAKFVGWTDAAGHFIQIEWCATQDRYDAFAGAGAKVFTFHANEIHTCTLIGKMVTGDGRKSWSAADFANWVS